MLCTGFACEEFREFTSCNDIHHTFTSPYHPAANRLAERSVQVVKRAIKRRGRHNGTFEQVSRAL